MLYLEAKKIPLCDSLMSPGYSKGMGIYFEQPKLQITEGLNSCKEKPRGIKIALNECENRISEVRKTGSLL